MENLTIKQLLESAGSKVNSLLKKIAVREFDEEGKGNYVSFVDEGEATYDVNIKLRGNNIEAMSCECAKPKPCIHIFAVAKNIHVPDARKAPLKRTKKELPEIQLLRTVDEAELREWVKALLAKNKDLVVAFTHHFSPRKEYNPAELTELTRQAVKSVVKNKKNIDLTMLKRIFELWGPIHEEVIEQYQSDLSNENSFNLIKVIVNQSLYYKNYFPINTVRFDSYIDDMLRSNANIISQLENLDTWRKVIQNIADSFLYEGKVFISHYVRQVYSLLEVSDTEKQAFIFEKLNDFAIRHKGSPDYWYSGFIKEFFYKTVEYRVFERYVSLFSVAGWQNDYNEALINELIKIKEYEKAEAFCNECISGNYNEEYNIPYWQLLKTIYLITGNKHGLRNICRLLLPYTYNFDDYLLVEEGITTDDERKKYSTKMFSSARRVSGRMYYLAMEFCYSLLNYEKKYLKMIDLIPSYSNYGLLIKYFETMFVASKERLLKNLIEKPDGSYFMYYTEETVKRQAEDEKLASTLLQMLISKYDYPFLEAAFKAKLNDRRYYAKNKLVISFEKEYLKKG